jgi:flap endonuclease-1
MKRNKMGIPKLNKWLLDHCSPQSIQKQHLELFINKRIAVDISIYLYRFLIDGRFMEQLYLFLAILKYYCIRPVFIFDGKPPIEKNATIQKRKLEKREARDLYAILEQQLLAATTESEKNSIKLKMQMARKKMVKITWEHIDNAIELMTAFGYEYYLAPHEADQLCVHLSQTGDVWAVLSDDMDLLISGCSRVLRAFNMNSHEVILYDTAAILSDIKMTPEHFREMVVLSGTDYDVSHTKPMITIKRAFELYSQYIADSKSEMFHEWLDAQGIITSSEFVKLCGLFDISNSKDELNVFLDRNKKICKVSISTIKTIMRRYKFIFLEN